MTEPKEKVFTKMTEKGCGNKNDMGIICTSHYVYQDGEKWFCNECDSEREIDLSWYK